MTSGAREVRLALLGGRPPARDWYAAIEASDHHHVVVAMGSAPGEAMVADHWEVLAGDERIDAALLVFPDDEAIEAARQLAMRGKSVVIDGECPLPSSVVAELSLLDAEGAAAIVPFFEWRAFPVHDHLRGLVIEGRLGDVIQLRVERHFTADASTSSRCTLSNDRIRSSLFPDIDLLRWIGGDYSQVTLLRTGATGDGFAAQTLTLSGPQLADATCTYRVGTDSGWSCEVQGTAGLARAAFDGQGLSLSVDGRTVLIQKFRRAEPDLCLRLLDDSLHRARGALRWQDRTRIHEIEEAMQRSLRRRRTIDLHFETASERSQFKTHMTTAGCFVLVYTFLASVGLLLAGAVLDPRDSLQQQAEAAGFVIEQDEFVPASHILAEMGRRKIREIGDRWDGTEVVVVVEQSAADSAADPEADALDQARLEAVRRELRERGVQRVEERTVLRRLTGQTFRTLMSIGRVIAFAPLGVFLLLQLFLLAARPSHGEAAVGAGNGE